MVSSVRSDSHPLLPSEENVAKHTEKKCGSKPSSRRSSRSGCGAHSHNVFLKPNVNANARKDRPSRWFASDIDDVYVDLSEEAQELPSSCEGAAGWWCQEFPTQTSCKNLLIRHQFLKHCDCCGFAGGFVAAGRW